MQKLVSQPDNSKCRYTDTRLQEGRRNTLVAVDGPLLRHSAFHPSVGGSENMSVELRHIEYGGDGDCGESHEVCSVLLGWSGLGGSCHHQHLLSHGKLRVSREPPGAVKISIQGK